MWAFTPSLAVLLVLAWSLFAIAQSPSDEVDPDQDPIVVRVEAVNILVTVVDRSTGEFVDDLEVEDFVLREDGVPQKITHFAKRTDVPLAIALCMDTSASVRLNLNFQKEAASEFLYRVMRTTDRALLLEFNTGVTLLHDFTSNPNSLIHEIQGLRAGGGTSLFDAVYLVGEQKMLEEEGRKTVVILSDGSDLTSRRTMEDALVMAHLAEMTIFAIGTSRIGATIDYEGERILRRLTEATGGRAFFPHSVRQLPEAFEQIDATLRNQYSLTYTPSNQREDGAFRKVEVRVARRGVDITHRSGYYAPSPDTPPWRR